MERIGILGGTFDPIHVGHLIAAAYACNHLSLDRVLLVPSSLPVHRPLHSPATMEHRVAMCRLAAAALPPFEVSEVEVARAEPSYTVLTLRYLAEAFGEEAELVLLLGEDNLHLLHTWRRLDQILDLATVAVLPRPVAEPPDLAALEASIGQEAVAEMLRHRVPGPLVAISATEIRRRVRAGISITGLVPASVGAYIAANGMYAETGRAGK